MCSTGINLKFLSYLHKYKKKSIEISDKFRINSFVRKYTGPNQICSLNFEPHISIKSKIHMGVLTMLNSELIFIFHHLRTKNKQ